MNSSKIRLSDPLPAAEFEEYVFAAHPQWGSSMKITCLVDWLFALSGAPHEITGFDSNRYRVDAEPKSRRRFVEFPGEVCR